MTIEPQPSVGFTPATYLFGIWADVCMLQYSMLQDARHAIVLDSLKPSKEAILLVRACCDLLSSQEAELRRKYHAPKYVMPRKVV